MSAAELQAAFEQAQAEVHELQAAKDAQIAALREQLSGAVDRLADLHKRWRDALALEALSDRADGSEVADRLGLADHDTPQEG
jgi:hypothetical protein